MIPKTFAVCFLIGSSALAQTVTTNYVTAARNFREVNGKLYNTEKSQLWSKLEFEVTEVTPSGVGAFKVRPIYHIYTDSATRTGNFLGGGLGDARVFDGYQHVMPVLISNCPPVVVGQLTNVMALKVGISKDGIETWDCGTPHVVMVVTTNRTALAAGK